MAAILGPNRNGGIGAKLQCLRQVRIGGTDNGLSSLGDLPSGEVSSLHVLENSTNTILATINGVGLYRSIDAGASWTRLMTC